MHANRAGSFVGQLLMLIPMGNIMHSGVTGTSLVLSGYGEPCHQWHHDCMTKWFCAVRLTLVLVILDAAGDLCAAGILATQHLHLQVSFQKCFHLQLSPLCGLLTQSLHLDMRSSLQMASPSWWRGRYLVTLVTE